MSLAGAAKTPIAVVYWYDGTLYAGIETVLSTFLQLHDPARVRPILVWAGLKKNAQFAREVAATGTEQIELTPAVGAPGHKLRRAAASLALLRRLRPALIHIHSGGALTHGVPLSLARGLGIPVVRTVHLPFGRWSWNQRALTGPLRRARNRLLASSVSRIIAVSNADRAELIQTGLFKPERCVMITNGTRLERFRGLPATAAAKLRIGLDPEQPTLGLVGRLTEQKQFNHTIAAMPALLKDHPHAKLLVIGDGPDREALRAQAESLGIGRAVTFFGHREDIPLCLAAFDLFAVPSRYESQGLVMLEAMAAGRPIVASPLDCFVEMVGEGGPAKLVDGDDSNQLARAYSRLLSDPAERARMGALGIERAKQFAAELNVARTQDLYDEILRDRTNRDAAAPDARDPK